MEGSVYKKIAKYYLRLMGNRKGRRGAGGEVIKT